jgi:hypothetical protein
MLGTCIQGTQSSCLALCTEKTADFPCRDGYSCFLATSISAVCLPTSISQCDPTQKGSCPMNDAGAAQTCVQVGLDPVGLCDTACNLFTQNCAPDVSDAGSTPRACYSNNFGEGVCDVAGPGGDGAMCQFISDCAAGLGCHVEGQSFVCRPYCGGPGNAACNNGKQCIDFSMTVPKTTLGYCAG